MGVSILPIAILSARTVVLRVNDPDSALESIVEGAFASAARKDLGFDDHIITLCYPSAVFRGHYQLYPDIPMLLATASASCGELATSPFGTPMPYYTS